MPCSEVYTRAVSARMGPEDHAPLQLVEDAQANGRWRRTMPLCAEPAGIVGKGAGKTGHGPHVTIKIRRECVPPHCVDSACLVLRSD